RGAIWAAGLGGERGGQGVQPVRIAPWQEGRERRAAPAHPAVPLQGYARRSPRYRRQVRSAGVCRDARTTRPAGHTRTEAARRSGCGVRTGHGQRIARRSREGAGAGPHHDPAFGSLQRCTARSRTTGGVGPGVRRVNLQFTPVPAAAAFPQGAWTVLPAPMADLAVARARSPAVLPIASAYPVRRP